MDKNHPPTGRRLGLVLALLLVSSAFLVTFAERVRAQEEPSINIISAPTGVVPGLKVTIEWEVKGTGKIAHTSVHWDTKQGNPADFKSYANAAPDFVAINPPNDAPKKYTLSFDAPPTGTIYYVVHAIVDEKNIYNPDGERKILVIAPQVVVRGPGALPGPAPGPYRPAPEPARGDIYAGEGPAIDTTMLLGIGAVLVVLVVVAVARSKRKKE